MALAPEAVFKVGHRMLLNEELLVSCMCALIPYWHVPGLYCI